MLHQGAVRQVVADVLVPLVADRPAHLVHLVDPVPHGKRVVARSAGSGAEKRTPFHVFGDLHTGQAEHGGGEIDEADQPVGDRPRLARRRALELLREPDDQRHANARVVEPPLVARQAVAVVGEEEDDRLVGQAVLLQLPQDIAHLFIHDRDQVVQVGHVAAHGRRIGIVGG